MSPPARTPVRRRAAVAMVAVAASWWGVRGVSSLLREVSGDSMVPTLAPGDTLLVLPLWRCPPVGSVVTVADPRAPGRETVKRLAATTGQPADHGGDVEVVPPGHIAIVGDSTLRSTDSRQYGPVPTRLLTGRAVARLWPRPRLLRRSAPR